MKRASGVLLPVFSLPSKYGIGCFSKEAYKFIDQLKEAGQSYWQILPLGPTGYGDSPYQSFSTYAGNPYFIDLKTLIKEGLLTKKECKVYDFGEQADSIDYEKIYNSRFKVLKKAFERFEKDEAYDNFIKENAYWLDDYSLYMAIKDSKGGISWNEWEEALKNREEAALENAREELAEEINFYKFSSMNSINSGHSFTLMQMNREFRSLEIFRFMLHLTVQIHGHLRSYSSLMKRIIRWQ